jgi:hypothetical protein
VISGLGIACLLGAMWFGFCSQDVSVKNTNTGGIIAAMAIVAIYVLASLACLGAAIWLAVR